MPGQGINDTEFALIDAELVSDPKGALRAFEDFSGLLGIQTWNPAREVLKLNRKNPAGDILRMHHIDPANTEAMNAIQMTQADQMVAEMRRHLGGGNELFDDSELFEALFSPGKPVVSSLKTHAEALAKISEKTVIIAMRDLLSPILSEGATDEDLLRAANDVENPLCCSGACQVQVLLRQKTPPQESLDFTPEMLGRKAHANLYRPWDRPRQPKEVKLVAHQSPVVVHVSRPAEAVDAIAEFTEPYQETEEQLVEEPSSGPTPPQPSEAAL
jgi:hypothetical protein